MTNLAVWESNPLQQHDVLPNIKLKIKQISNIMLTKIVMKTFQIVEKVARHCSFQDLKQFRQVNRVWNLVCCKLIEPKCKPIRVIMGSALKTDFWMSASSCKICTSSNLRQLLQVINSSSGFPCKKFSLQSGVKQSQQDNRVFVAFVDLVRETGTDLEILGSFNRYVAPVGYFTMNEWKTLNRFSISFSGCFKQRDTMEMNMQFIGQILKSAPNLKTIKYYCVYDPRIQTLFIDSLSNLVILKELHLEGRFSSENFRLLQKMSELRLSSLTLEISSTDPETFAEMTKFLGTQAYCLEFLKLSVVTSRELEHFVFPKLKTLRLNQSFRVYPRPGPTRFPVINFAKQMPVLENLEIWNMHRFNIAEWMMSTTDVAASVVSLNLPTRILNPDIILKFAGTFKNLQKLKIDDPHPQCVKAIAQSMESLKELTLTFSSFSFYVSNSHSLNDVLHPLAELPDGEYFRSM